jgi:hypothetical protein
VVFGFWFTGQDPVSADNQQTTGRCVRFII